jgi:hypothetical protein
VAAAHADEVGGQTMPLGASLQSLMQRLAAELGISFTKQAQQRLLSGPQGRHALIRGMGAVSHGRVGEGRRQVRNLLEREPFS